MENNPKYTDLQFSRYVSGILYDRLCHIQTALNLMYDGKFFQAEKSLIGIRDSLLNLRNQAEKRCIQLNLNKDEGNDGDNIENK